MNITTVDNSMLGIWRAHREGCKDIKVDAKRLGANSITHTHSTALGMAEYVGCMDIATDMYSPGDEEFFEEVGANLSAMVFPASCCESEFYDWVDEIKAQRN